MSKIESFWKVDTAAEPFAEVLIVQLALPCGILELHKEPEVRMVDFLRKLNFKQVQQLISCQVSIFLTVFKESLPHELVILLELCFNQGVELYKPATDIFRVHVSCKILGRPEGLNIREFREENTTKFVDRHLRMRVVHIK